jgi:hypothetical protein
VNTLDYQFLTALLADDPEINLQNNFTGEISR